MWAQSELSISRLCVLKFLTLALMTSGLSVSWAVEAMLQAEDLMRPEKLVEYRKQASPTDRVLSEKIYQYAVEAAKKDWGAAAKGFAESALAYPNSRALIKMAESRLRMLAHKDENIKVDALNNAVKYLDTALVLNMADQMLNPQEQKQIEEDMVCVEQYLVDKKILSDCRPLNWINLR